MDYVLSTALVLHGGKGLNPGLPLTDNQKAVQQQTQRAAAAQVSNRCEFE